MNKRKFHVEELDLLDDYVTIESRKYRWGTTDTNVAKMEDGTYWMFDVDVHHSYGWQVDGPIDAVQVHPIERFVVVTKWEPVE